MMFGPGGSRHELGPESLMCHDTLAPGAVRSVSQGEKQVRSKGIVSNIVGMVRSYVTERAQRVHTLSTRTDEFEYTVLTRHGHGSRRLCRDSPIKWAFWKSLDIDSQRSHRLVNVLGPEVCNLRWRAQSRPE